MSSTPDTIVEAVKSLRLDDSPLAPDPDVGTVIPLAGAVLPAIVAPPIDAAPSIIVAPPTPPTSGGVSRPTELDSPADVILPFRGRRIVRITTGIQNHDFRTYLLHSDVQYVWLLEDDVNAIRFIITIGAPRRPGEVNDPTGDGNNAFDAGLRADKYGYPIYEVYRLPCDLTAKVLRDDYGIDISKGKQYAAQALVNAFPLDSLYRIIPYLESEEDEVD